MKQSGSPRLERSWALLLLPPALAAGFLAPYLFLGRVLLPLELLAIFQPWSRHSAELWGSVPLASNPLLDSLQQYYPRRVYFTEAVRGGWLPLWNPYSYGGSPFHAAQQGGMLYPPAWLLAFLPPEHQFAWSAFLHLSIAGVGALLFFQRLGLKAAAAATGSAAFAFNGFVVVWLAYPNVTAWTLCWLPLALYLWERGRQTDDLRWLGASGASLALNLLGGHGQSSEYVLLTWLAWAGFRTLHRGCTPGRILRWIAWPAALSVVLSLGQVLPALDFLPRTDRAGRLPWEQVTANSMPWAQLWTFLLPRLFGDDTLSFGQAHHWLPHAGHADFAFVERSFYPGAVVLVLSGAGVPFVLRARRHSEESSTLHQLAAFGCILSIAGLLLAATPLYWVLWRLVPGFGQFTAVGRVVCVTAWGLACVAAVTVERLGRQGHGEAGETGRAVCVAALVLASAASVGHFIFGGAAPQEVAQMLAAGGAPSPDAIANGDFSRCLALLAGVGFLGGLGSRLIPSRLRGIGPVGCAVLVVLDLFAFGAGFNPAADSQLAGKTTPEIKRLLGREDQARVISVGPPDSPLTLQRRMPSNLLSVFSQGDILGSDSFVTRRYREWEAAAIAADGGTAWSRPGAPALRAASVRYYLTGARTLFPGFRSLVGEALQEDPGALPYARVHSGVRSTDSRDELFARLREPQRDPSVALGYGLPGGLGSSPNESPNTVAPYAVRRPNGNRVVAHGENPASGLLVVCEQLEPGWRVTVDGNPASPVPADHLFIGVPLTAGRHSVELRYFPDVFRVGLFGSLFSAALLCACLVGVRARGSSTDTGAPGSSRRRPSRSR